MQLLVHSPLAAQVTSHDLAQIQTTMVTGTTRSALMLNTMQIPGIAQSSSFRLVIWLLPGCFTSFHMKPFFAPVVSALGGMFLCDVIADSLYTGMQAPILPVPPY